MGKIFQLSYILLITLLFTGCSDMIEYSPYDTDVVAKSLNLKSADQLSKDLDISIDTLKFALISDPHTFYDDLEKAVKCINQQEGLQFVVCCGDLTDCGLSQEYSWYYDATKVSKYPVISVIGNHDYRSNGKQIYEQMFGPTNMSFTLMGYNFIVFDDIVWENNNQSPDFIWLENELSSTKGPSIILTHIPPATDQLEGLYSETYGDIISKNNVMLCIHGHQHDYALNTFKEVPYIISGSIEKNKISIISVYGNEFNIQRIDF